MINPSTSTEYQHKTNYLMSACSPHILEYSTLVLLVNSLWSPGDQLKTSWSGALRLLHLSPRGAKWNAAGFVNGRQWIKVSGRFGGEELGFSALTVNSENSEQMHMTHSIAVVISMYEFPERASLEKFQAWRITNCQGKVSKRSRPSALSLRIRKRDLLLIWSWNSPIIVGRLTV